MIRTGGMREEILPMEFRRAVCLAMLVLATGCASTARKPAVPFELSTQATVAGFPAGIRYFPRDATDVKEFERDFLRSNEIERFIKTAMATPKTMASANPIRAAIEGTKPW